MGAQSFSFKEQRMVQLIPFFLLAVPAISINIQPEPCRVHKCMEDGVFPEGSCSEFFCYCTNGNGILENCEDIDLGLIFNPDIPRCDWPWNVEGCSSTATPTSSSASTSTSATMTTERTTTPPTPTISTTTTMTTSISTPTPTTTVTPTTATSTTTESTTITT